MTYGYRYGEVPTPALKDGVKDRTFIKEGECDTSRRPPVAVSLGPHVQGVALPHPCPADKDTMIAGAIKRFAAKPPEPDEELLRQFEEYVARWLTKNLVPLAPDADTSVERWLKHSGYPEWRKVDLRMKWARVACIWGDKRYMKVKSFMKDEGYAAEEYKHARGINSRTDEYKCAVGPIFKLIETEVFKHPAFIKKVPVDQRASYIMERIYREGGTYIATDYTSFEALFTKRLMAACEFQLYRYMTQYLPEANDFDRHLEEVLGGTNHCSFKFFSLWVEATRMSGEMCTSLGNGFSNLMLLNFACHSIGAECHECVEGDDGVARCEGGTPTPELFEKLGMRIKLEKHLDLSRASFCGLVFDIDERRNVTDPRKVLASFGWTELRYAKARNNKLRQLLRCKSLSLAFQYPGCPIISALARYGLRVTHGVTVGTRILDQMRFYEREFLLSMLGLEDSPAHGLRGDYGVPDVPVGPRTRVLVEELYGISIAQQLHLEKMLDDKHDASPIDCSCIEFPRIWYDYFGSYALGVRVDNNELCYPGHLWDKMAGFSKEW